MPPSVRGLEFTSPPFTIKQLRDVVPPHCFQRSVLISSLYLLWDLTCIVILFYSASYIDGFHWKLSTILWPLYWIVQGAFMTGVWVIAHECGHQAYSDSKIINNTVGLILHSLLLVPYHSWRISHGQHHKMTSHMDKDQVFVPKTLSKIRAQGDIHDLVSDSPLVSLVQLGLMLLFGWPFYLAKNSWGQNYERRTNHFEPSSPVFKPEHRFYIIQSDIALIAVFGFLCYLSYTFSFLTIIKFYGIPYLIVNLWLVLITFLQHTDMKVPHYRGNEWNFIRGALAAVDRDYGILNNVFHHIGDTHIAHHLFSTMPHYHAQEATESLKKVLGEFYLHDETPIFLALWKNFTSCHYVEDQGDILFYNTLNNSTVAKKLK